MQKTLKIYIFYFFWNIYGTIISSAFSGEMKKIGFAWCHFVWLCDSSIYLFNSSLSVIQNYAVWRRLFSSLFLSSAYVHFYFSWSCSLWNWYCLHCSAKQTTSTWLFCGSTFFCLFGRNYFDCICLPEIEVVKIGSGDNILVGYESSEDVLKAKGGIEWAATDQGLFGTYDYGTVALFWYSQTAQLSELQAKKLKINSQLDLLNHT